MLLLRRPIFAGDDIHACVLDTGKEDVYRAAALASYGIEARFFDGPAVSLTTERTETSKGTISDATGELASSSVCFVGGQHGARKVHAVPESGRRHTAQHGWRKPRGRMTRWRDGESHRVEGPPRASAPSAPRGRRPPPSQKRLWRARCVTKGARRGRRGSAGIRAGAEPGTASVAHSPNLGG